MTVNITDRSDLQRALRQNWEAAGEERRARERLLDVYESKTDWWDPDGADEDKPLVNLPVQYVRGHVLSLAFGLPKWRIGARSPLARGLDFRVENMLTRLNELGGLRDNMRSWAYDSAFGRAVAKTKRGVAPRGVTSPVSPRTYRVPPNLLLYDRTAASIFESTYYGDLYLVPLNEARAYVGYSAEWKNSITEYTDTSDRMLPAGTDHTYFAEPMTRMLDVYFPALGAIFTWPCQNDTFSEISSMPAIETTRTPVNPYSIFQLILTPDKPDDYAMLETLIPIHLGANDMLKKGLEQGRHSKRNPIYQLTAEHDMDTVLNVPDNEAAGLEDPASLGLYTLPGPDPSILSLGGMLLGLFSQYGGNVEVALGQSAGASTARQTQAILGQINALQSIARTEFDVFLADIGKKQVALAFEDELFQMNIATPVPGTRITINQGWSRSLIPNSMVSVSDLLLEVVPYSTAFRPPAEYVTQLEAASAAIMKWMQAMAMGLPVNIQAIMRSYSRAFDLIPELQEWWSGDEVKPSPAEKAGQIYQSFASNTGPSQREINYQGVGNQGGSPIAEPSMGGLSGFGQ